MKAATIPADGGMTVRRLEILLVVDGCYDESGQGPGRRRSKLPPRRHSVELYTNG
jgi:hypothetical protein